MSEVVITPAEAGWVMLEPGQPGNYELIELPVTEWCCVDGQFGPYIAGRSKYFLPVIAAVRRLSDDKFFIHGKFGAGPQRVPREGLANRLRALIDARFKKLGMMK